MIIEDTVLGLALILLLGLGAQWIAWRLGVPAILFLLGLGILSGPVLGIIQPDKILGELLFPIVSVAVAILVFEGALNLRFAELRKTGAAVRNLLTLGMLLTCGLCALAAHFFLDMDFPSALLLGSILIVTGPTVITPLLRHVRISSNISTILRWESIIIDPIGAILAILVYETFFGAHQARFWSSTFTLVNTILLGACFGFLAAHLLLLLIRREIIPEFLQSPFTLMSLIASFALSNILQQESGLLAVTVMGLVMANQSHVAIKKITEFKETLQVLLIASLFIVLSARIDVLSLNMINLQTVFFVLTLLFLVRPISVFCSAWGTGLKWRELVFLSAIAPRGIVAAAISSLLAIELRQAAHPQSEVLVTTVFIVIVVSGITATLFAKPLARFLDLELPEPRGFLFLGAHNWARDLAQVLQERGIPILLVDTNPYNVYKARMQNLKIVYASILEEEARMRLDLSEVGAFIALTSNDEVNSLAALSFQDILGKNKVYQIPSFTPEEGEIKKIGSRKSLHGKQLFSTRPPVIRLSGLSPNQDAKCLALGHFVMSVPISLITLSAVKPSMPSIRVRSTPVIRYRCAPNVEAGCVALTAPPAIVGRRPAIAEVLEPFQLGFNLPGRTRQSYLDRTGTAPGPGSARRYAPPASAPATTWQSWLRLLSCQDDGTAPAFGGPVRRPRWPR